MKYLTFVYKYKEKDINVYVTLKRQSNIYYRFKDGSFYITAPTFTSLKLIVKGLDKYAEKLVTRFTNYYTNYSFEEDYVYLLGEKVSLKQLEITDKDDLKEFLFCKCHEFIEPLVRKYEEIMGTKVMHKISFKHTKNQFGSNAKNTKHLSFQIELIHYSLEIIESVVVHEIAHNFERNHGENFYNIVYTYCPKYKEVQRKLKKGIHKWLAK